MKPRDIIQRYRVLSKDTNETDPDIKDTELLMFINDCTLLLNDKRPDAFIGASSVTSATEATDTQIDTDDIIPLGSSWRSAYVDYVCFRAFSSEGRDKEDLQRAALHWAAFKETVGF